MPRRVGAIDIGTNTVLLLVAGGSPEAPIAVLERATITRLGQGVDSAGNLSPEAVERTLLCLAEYRRELATHGATRVDVVCTSAARDARNGDAFLDRASAALGVRPRIVDGQEEARLTFDGALSGLDVSGPVIVVDVGGGSTEIIVGRGGDPGTIESEASLDIGSVRLTERHVRSDPPRPDELTRIEADVRHALAGLGSPPRPSTVVGVAGTVTTLASLAQSLPVYDSARVHGSRLSRSTVTELERKLASVPLEARQRLSGLEPARADVIVAGTVLFRTVLDWLGASEIVVSDRGVRWGLARRALLSLEKETAP